MDTLQDNAVRDHIKNAFERERTKAKKERLDQMAMSVMPALINRLLEDENSVRLLDNHEDYRAAYKVLAKHSYMIAEAMVEVSDGDLV